MLFPPSPNLAQVAWHIAAALFNLHFHGQLAAGGKMSNDVIRIDDFDIVRDLDIAARTTPSPSLRDGGTTSSRLCSLKTTPLRLRRMSTTSS
jgi:hypothetical protein